MRYVGVGRRAVAQVIDMLFSLMWWIPFAKIDHLSGGGYQLTWTAGRAMVPICISALYFVLLEGLVGATVGKFIVGVRVMAADGSSIGWGASVTRNLLRVVDGIPYAIPYLLGAIAIWSDGPTKQRLGDRVAHTVVIRAGAQAPEMEAPAMPRLHELSPEAAVPPLPLPPGARGEAEETEPLTNDRPWT